MRAKNFAYALRRILSPKLRSPAAQFITEPYGGIYVTGFKARGLKLVVWLRNPSGRFLPYLSMPFFQATSTKLPLGREVTEVHKMNEIPSAGPYALTYNDQGRTTRIRRNPYYGGSRPHTVRGATVFWNRDEHKAFLQTLKGKYDRFTVPPGYACSRDKCHRQRFEVRPLSCVGYAAFNNRKGLFSRNPAMRKAVSWALSRRDYANQAGKYLASPWTHLLPPGFPGSITKKKLQPYAAKSDYAKARRIAAGHFKDGKIIVVYQDWGDVGPRQKDVVIRDLILPRSL